MDVINATQMALKTYQAAIYMTCFTMTPKERVEAYGTQDLCELIKMPANELMDKAEVWADKVIEKRERCKKMIRRIDEQNEVERMTELGG